MNLHIDTNTNEQFGLIDEFKFIDFLKKLQSHLQVIIDEVALVVK